MDQGTFLTQEIEDSFSAKKKVGAVFVDLRAAYDTVWQHGFTCKLLRLIPDRHMVKFIMELMRNRSFILTTGTGPKSRLRHLRNEVAQGSVLALLFNTYTHDLSTNLEEVGICRRSSNYALHKGLEGVRGSSIPRHDNSVDASQKMEAKTVQPKQCQLLFILTTEK